MSKLSDSSCYGKITQSTKTFMKELSINKVIWMDKNALEVTVSVYDGDLWCQVMPFQVQSYSRHFQHLLSHIYMHYFCSKEKGDERSEIDFKRLRKKREKKNIPEQGKR